MPYLERDGEVLLLDLGDDENRFTPDWIAAVNAALDEAEASDGPKALVTKARGKFFSNGLDLDWLMANPDQRQDYLGAAHMLFARMLSLPIPSVAAVQGHCFAAGAMLQVGHDFSVMRADRGFWCVPEIDLQLPFTTGMTELLMCRLPKKTAHDAMTTGKRYGGLEAREHGIVDATANSEEHVLEVAVEIARPLAPKASAALGVIKSRMYAATLNELRTGDWTLRGV